MFENISNFGGTAGFREFCTSSSSIAIDSPFRATQSCYLDINMGCGSGRLEVDISISSRRISFERSRLKHAQNLPRR